MSDDGSSMGNLEKLGILVIVILVVVVGVVAITPSDTLFPSGSGGENDTALLESGSTPPGRTPEAGPQGEPLDEVPPAPPLAPWPGEETAADPLGNGAPADGLGPDARASAPPPSDQLVPAPAPGPDPFAAKGPTPEPVPPPVAPAPVEPAFREYEVRSGDSFYRIAERELGAANRYKEIAALNPTVDPARLRLGQKLRLPVAGGAAVPTPRSGTAPADGAAAAAAPGVYVVQPGDTAMGISQKLWGTTRHWRTLLEYNGISDPESLRRDAKLRVPELARSSSDPAAPTSEAPARSPSPRTVSGTGGRTYVVRAGDTLSRIAARELHDGSRWKELQDLNGLASPRDLQAGQTLRLPE